MKNPKTFLFLSIIVAVLILGVAYASFTREFVVTGTATSAVADGSAFEVLVTDVASKQISGTGAVFATNVKETDVDKITGVTYSVTGMKKGDIAEFIITVSNNSEDLNAVITKFATAVSGDTAYFKVYGEQTNKESQPALTASTIAAKGTATFTVYVESIKDTSEAAGKTITITTTFQADPADVQ